MSNPERDAISEDGLRYTARQAGSPFGSSTTGAAKKSCLLCGHHKFPSQGRQRKMLGRHHFVCFGCQPG